MEKGRIPNDDLRALLEKFANNTCSREELEHLLAIASRETPELADAFQLQWARTSDGTDQEKEDWSALFQAMMQKARQAETDNAERLSTIHVEKAHHVRNGRRRLVIWAAAAAVVLLVFSSAAFLFFRTGSPSVGIAQQRAKNRAPVNDVAPGGDKAILTLADGRQIVLDTASNGALTKQGGIRVIKIGGQLTYNPEGGAVAVVYNTISTPKGGQYRLELADGSRVWLNAASSLRFPTAFAGADRTVDLSGEGYFEVAHDAGKPFHVRVNGLDVEVLGTHFNINAYADEAQLKTTLLQGRVKVTAAAQSVFLNPGQQAETSYGSPASRTIRVENDVDVEDVVAWKDGLFNFEHSDINKILRDFARWYDVDIQVNGTISDQKKFFGIVRRNTSLASAISVLKNAGADIDYRIEGKKLLVQAVDKR